MEISQLFLIFLVKIFCNEADGYNLTWEVEQKVVKYGEDVSLFCKVENCCEEAAGWGTWTVENGFSTIFIDVKNLKVDKSSKYGGSTSKRGFFLVIRNITKQDLNTTYSCTYGFLVSPKKLLTEIDAFIGFHSAESSDGSKAILLVVLPLSLTAVGAAVGLVALIIVICRRSKLQGTHKKADEKPKNNNNSASDQELKKTMTITNNKGILEEEVQINFSTEDFLLSPLNPSFYSPLKFDNIDASSDESDESVYYETETG